MHALLHRVFVDDARGRLSACYFHRPSPHCHIGSETALNFNARARALPVEAEYALLSSNQLWRGHGLSRIHCSCVTSYSRGALNTLHETAHSRPHGGLSTTQARAAHDDELSSDGA